MYILCSERTWCVQQGEGALLSAESVQPAKNHLKLTVQITPAIDKAREVQMILETFTLQQSVTSCILQHASLLHVLVDLDMLCFPAIT